MDITPLLSYLKSTSNLALSCKGFAWRVSSNGFPIKSSVGDLCLENLAFYKLLDYPDLDQWTIKKFTMAIKTNDSNQLLLLLKSGANIEANDCDGWTALLWAASKGRTECLQLLLGHKANIETKNKHGSTPLILTSLYGKVECLKLLLDRGANIETENRYRTTALILAASEGRTDCLKLLLQHNANLETKDKDGWTALTVAVFNGKTDCLKLLWDHGAKVDPWLRENYPKYKDLWGDSTL